MYHDDQQPRQNWKDYSKSNGILRMGSGESFSFAHIFIVLILIAVAAYFGAQHMGYVFPSTNSRASTIASELQQRATRACLWREFPIPNSSTRGFVELACTQYEARDISHKQNKVIIDAYFSTTELIDGFLHYPTPDIPRFSGPLHPGAMSFGGVTGATCHTVRATITPLTQKHWSKEGSALYAEGVEVAVNLLDQHGTPIRSAPITFSAQDCVRKDLHFKPDGTYSQSY